MYFYVPYSVEYYHTMPRRQQIVTSDIAESLPSVKEERTTPVPTGAALDHAYVDLISTMDTTVTARIAVQQRLRDANAHLARLRFAQVCLIKVKSA